MAAGDENSPVIDFTSIDYASLRADLLRYAQGTCGLNLTDLNPQDPAVMLLNCLAYVGDLFGYNLNQLVKEAIPALALRKPNFEAAAKSLGWKSKAATAALVDLAFTVDLDDVGGGPVTITKHYKAATQDGVVFQPNGDTTVGPGSGVTVVTVGATEGDEIEDEAIGASTGGQMQRYTLGSKPLLEETLVVEVGGVEWTRVDLIALAAATDKAYELSYENDGTAAVTFGDGINGLIPTTAAAITATYKVGGGTRGNVDAGTVTRKVTTLAGVKSVTNPAKAAGGGDAQSLFSAQASLPGFVRSNDRAVSEGDYAAVALTVTGVLKAIDDAGRCGDGGCGAPVVVYAIPNGGGSLTTPLIANIQTALRAKKMLGKRVIVQDASYVQLKLAVDVYVRPTASAADVKALVTNIILDKYDLTSMQFGATLSVQDLYDDLSPTIVRGLSRVFIERFSVAPHAERYKNFPTTGNGVVTNVEATAATRREWQITVTDGGAVGLPATFAVTERYLGTVTDLSDIAMSDDEADFPNPNGFVGATPPWYLRLNPYDTTSTAKAVIGNTESAITVDAGDLRALGSVGDEYVVERQQLRVGVVYKQTFAGPVAGGATVLPLPGTWGLGTRVRIYDAPGGSTPVTTFETTIASGTTGAYNISPGVPAGGLAGTVTVEAYWLSDDGKVKFVLAQGTLRFTTGDTLYVDTYEDVEDVELRRLNFPRIVSVAGTAPDLVVRTIGGKA
jgi:phage-related baseplate assembly protein